MLSPRRGHGTGGVIMELNASQFAQVESAYRAERLSRSVRDHAARQQRRQHRRRRAARGHGGGRAVVVRAA